MGEVSRGAGVRGVTVPSPEGWSVPDAAERLAALARQHGWSVLDQRWYYDRRKGLQTFFLGVGRPLGPGDTRPGAGWQYHVVWEEVPEEERATRHWARMTVRVSRAYTPKTARWLNGPSVKAISDTIIRNPLRNRPS